MNLTLEMAEELYEELVALADLKMCAEEDLSFSPDGTNLNDAYALGMKDGQIQLARRIIKPPMGELDSAEGGGDI